MSANTLMCSFLFARSLSVITDEALLTANRYAHFRGMDATELFRTTDSVGMHLTFVPNLLDISGNSSKQPVFSGDSNEFTVHFNGEIYNHQELSCHKTDTDCTIPQYLAHEINALAKFDGEFSIATYDGQENRLTIFADPFLTKPLYLGMQGDNVEFAVATCTSSLKSLGCSDIQLAKPNTTIQINFMSNGYEVQELENVIKFSLDQHKDQYTDWVAVLLNAVKKRAIHGTHKPMDFLLSGYDSGAICQALNQQDIVYDTFSIAASEDKSILKQRIRMNKTHSCENVFRINGLNSFDVAPFRALVNMGLGGIVRQRALEEYDWRVVAPELDVIYQGNFT